MKFLNIKVDELDKIADVIYAANKKFNPDNEAAISFRISSFNDTGKYPNPKTILSEINQKINNDVLITAIKIGALDCFEFYFDKMNKLELNEVDSDGNTVAFIAVASDRPKILSVLIETKIDINKANNQKITPLMVASSSGFVVLLI